MNTTTHRFSGTLKKWNAERGFGFLVAEQSGQELFVHLSAFPRDGRKPVLDEVLTFEVEPDRDGRKRAVRVRRPGDASAAHQTRGAGQSVNQNHHRSQSSRSDSSASWLVPILGLLVVAAMGWFGYGQYTERAEAARTATQPVASPVSNGQNWPTATTAPQSSFVCDGRQYCSQMTSCAEAKHFLKNCPGVKMDGNGDGVPCEQQWCIGPLGN